MKNTNRPVKRIWDKLSTEQKTMWTQLNVIFNDISSYPPQSPTFKCTKKEIECIAHNHALLAVWRMNDYCEWREDKEAK